MTGLVRYGAATSASATSYPTSMQRFMTSPSPGITPINALLLKTLPKLEKRLDRFAGESRDEALIRYVSTNTGQSRRRTTRLLQSLGLLEPTITGSEAGRQLGVSPQRIYQLVGQIRHRSEQAQPPNGAAPWLPQDPTAVPTILKGHTG